MLPPILEIYAVWHSGDLTGRSVADRICHHFHGTSFTGLIGGAVEVYIRSEPWRTRDDAPRPIPMPDTPPPNGIAQAQIIAIVPILGNEFAASIQPGTGPWHDYATRIVAATTSDPRRVGVYPIVLNAGAMDGTELGRIFAPFQRVGVPQAGAEAEPENEIRCRDLAQGIAQLSAGPLGDRLTVFISHTRRASPDDGGDVLGLIEGVRRIIGQTRLREFFDAHDLQPGGDWEAQLRAQAATSALLALRTDLYASREWCQREMLIAKREGMPVVILDALAHGEERGSFLMDHVPRVPLRTTDGGWRNSDIRRGLNLLVDESLKRTLWRRQAELGRTRPELEIAWWAPHAPEPATLLTWLESERAAGRLRDAKSLRVVHPDPPLGADEKEVLEQIATLGGVPGRLDIMTPRLLAARGG